MKKLKNYAIALAVLTAGCATYFGVNKTFEKNYDKSRGITNQLKIYTNNDSIEDKLETMYGIELTKEIQGHKLPANEMYITTFSLPDGRGAFHIKKVDPYYMAMRFDYVNLNKKMGCEYDDIAKKWWKLNNSDRKLYDSEASKFWKNKKVLVYNPKKDKSGGNKAVICIAQDWGPAAFVVRHAGMQVIDASNETVRYLFGKRCSGWSSRNYVEVYLLANQGLETGPVSLK